MNKKWFIAAGLCIVIGVAGMVAYGAPWSQQVMKETTAINKKWTFTRGQLQKLKVDSSDDVSILFTPGSGDQGTIRISGEVQTKVADQIHNARIENGKLTIQSEPAASLSFLSITPDVDQTITVEMPSGETLTDLQIDAHSGNVKLQDASVQNTSITATSRHCRDYKPPKYPPDRKFNIRQFYSQSACSRYGVEAYFWRCYHPRL